MQEAGLEQPPLSQLLRESYLAEARAQPRHSEMSRSDSSSSSRRLFYGPVKGRAGEARGQDADPQFPDLSAFLNQEELDKSVDLACQAIGHESREERSEVRAAVVPSDPLPAGVAPPSAGSTPADTLVPQPACGPRELPSAQSTARDGFPEQGSSGTSNSCGDVGRCPMSAPYGAETQSKKEFLYKAEDFIEELSSLFKANSSKRVRPRTCKVHRSRAHNKSPSDGTVAPVTPDDRERPTMLFEAEMDKANDDASYRPEAQLEPGSSFTQFPMQDCRITEEQRYSSHSEGVAQESPALTDTLYSADTVCEPPRFIQKLKSREVPEGSKVQLDCIVRGLPLPEVRWFCEGKELENSPDIQILTNGEHHSLIITDAFEEDTGRYSCFASNLYGTDSTSAEIYIEGATSTDSEGEQRVEHVAQLQREGTQPASGPVVSAAVEELLTPQPTTEEEPLLQELPSQPTSQESPVPLHSVRTSAIVLPVLEPSQPPEASAPHPPRVGPAAATVCVSPPSLAEETQVLSVTLPDVSIPEPEQSAVAINSLPTSPVAPVQLAQAVSAIAESQSNHHYLQGIEVRLCMAAPVFTKSLQDLLAFEGQLVVLEGRVKGVPSPRVDWYREGILIEDSPDFRILQKKPRSPAETEEICTLVIAEVFSGDSGMFTCTASNKYGTVSSIATLRVEGGGSNGRHTKTQFSLPVELSQAQAPYSSNLPAPPVKPQPEVTVTNSRKTRSSTIRLDPLSSSTFGLDPYSPSMLCSDPPSTSLANQSTASHVAPVSLSSPCLDPLYGSSLPQTLPEAPSYLRPFFGWPAPETSTSDLKAEQEMSKPPPALPDLAVAKRPRVPGTASRRGEAPVVVPLPDPPANSCLKTGALVRHKVSTSRVGRHVHFKLPEEEEEDEEEESDVSSQSDEDLSQMLNKGPPPVLAKPKLGPAQLQILHNQVLLEQKQDTDSPSQAQSHTQSHAQNQSQNQVQNQSHTQNEVQSQAQSHAQSHAENQSQNQVQNQRDTQSHAQSHAQNQSQNQVQNQRDTQSHAQSHAQSHTKNQAQSHAQNHTHSQNHTQSQAQNQIYTQSQVQNWGQNQTQSQPKTPPQTRLQVQSQFHPTMETQNQPQFQKQPNSEAQAQSKPQTQIQTHIHPHPQPLIQTLPQTQVHTQIQVQTQSQFQTQSQTQFLVQTQSQVQTQIQPQPVTQRPPDRVIWSPRMQRVSHPVLPYPTPPSHPAAPLTSISLPQAPRLQIPPVVTSPPPFPQLSSAPPPRLTSVAHSNATLHASHLQLAPLARSAAPQPVPSPAAMLRSSHASLMNLAPSSQSFHYARPREFIAAQCLSPLRGPSPTESPVPLLQELAAELNSSAASSPTLPPFPPPPRVFPTRVLASPTSPPTQVSSPTLLPAHFLNSVFALRTQSPPQASSSSSPCSGSSTPSPIQNPVAFLSSVLPSLPTAPPTNAMGLPKGAPPGPQGTLKRLPRTHSSSNEDLRESKEALLYDIEKKLRFRDDSTRFGHQQKLINEGKTVSRPFGPNIPATVFNYDEEYRVSNFEQRLMSEVEFRLERTPVEESDDEVQHDEIPTGRCIAPIFEKKLKNFKAMEGVPVTFSCKVLGIPIPKVYWFKDGKQILRKHDHYKKIREGDGTCALHIDPTTADDDGNYTIMASNPQGRISCSGHLIVQTGPPRNRMTPIHSQRVRARIQEVEEGEQTQERFFKPHFLQAPGDLLGHEGRLCRLDCKVSGLPNPELMWLVNGKPIYPDLYHKMLVTENGIHSLVIDPLKQSDAGTYTCIASNKAGQSSFSLELNVAEREMKRPPHFVEKLQNTGIPEGTPVRLVCRVLGMPPPVIFWKKDNDTIPKTKDRCSMHQDATGYVCLLIQPTRKEDAGWYTVSAKNDAGIISCTARLDIYAQWHQSIPMPMKKVPRAGSRYAALTGQGLDIKSAFPTAENSPILFSSSPREAMLESEEL